MPLRDGSDRRATERVRAMGFHEDAGQPILVGSPVAHPPHHDVAAGSAADCAERVAAVLQKLGYGFALIPRRQPATRGD